MDGLKEWVRQLVLLVLVASCLDMLLPMNSMKKYVRMAMGLLVMLAITRPIFGFLGQPVTVDEKLFTTAPEGGGLPSLNEILAKAAEFREQNMALVTGEARAALNAEAAKAATEVEGVAEATATVDLIMVDNQQRIRNVKVTIRPGQEGAVQPVEPVQPVRPIKAPDPGPVPPPGGEQPGGAREPLPAEQQLAAAVRQVVADRLGIAGDPRLIQVLVASKGGRLP